MEGWQGLADADGILRAADASCAGLDSRDLARLVEADELIRLGRGWYSLPLPPLPPELDTPWERRRQLHAAQARAAVKAFDGRAIASHHSALVLHALPAYCADLRQVHLTRGSDTLSRKRRGLTVHQTLRGACSTDGVMAPAVSIVQAGCVNGAMASLVAADAALHREMIRPEDLDEAVTLVLDPRSHPVRTLMGLCDGRAESPGETRLRHTLHLMGFVPEPQVRIVDGSFVAVVDFLLEDLVAIEFDGFVKYGRTEPLRTRAAPGDTVFAEKIREDHIRDLEHEMVRVIWSDLDAVPRLRHRVDRALARARSRRLGTRASS